MKYICELCGWIYEEEMGYQPEGIEPGTLFADIPDTFECPFCAQGKEAFDPMTTRKTK